MLEFEFHDTHKMAADDDRRHQQPQQPAPHSAKIVEPAQSLPMPQTRQMTQQQQCHHNNDDLATSKDEDVEEFHPNKQLPQQQQQEKRPRRDLPAETVTILKAWMLSPDHIEHPYPTDEVSECMLQTNGTLSRCRRRKNELC